MIKVLEPCGSSNRLRRRNKASILVCVIVIMLVVSLLAAQSLQTVFVIRRGDTQRSNLRQARELVELGRIVAMRESEGMKVVSLDLPDNATGTVEILSNQRVRATYRRGSNEIVASSQPRIADKIGE